MKKIFTLLFVVYSSFFAFADEGMWLPMLLKSLNEKDMKKNGLKLSAEDIYSINKSSLKDAVVHFGGGCTAEIISESGLLLTNHHCGYSQIAAHSSVEKDYLTDGFWAMNKEQELTNPGLTASIIQYMKDVTKEVKIGIQPHFTDKQKDSVIRVNSTRIERETVKGTQYEAYIRPFFYGNEYYMFVVETFKDVRLVGAPPSAIGKFGGETDNWVWPRHTGDFSLFRIYAGKDNKPAEYSPDNVPYKPKKSLTISLKGVKEGDFTMVYGFPGRTQEYLTSDAVDLIMNQSDPDKVNLREARLNIMDAYMKASDTTRINYASKYASIANYWKKWAGEMGGLKYSDALKVKKEFQEKFIRLLNTDPAKQKRFTQVLNEFQSIYEQMKSLTKQMDYFSEGIMGVEGFQYMRSYVGLFDGYAAIKAGGSGTFERDLDNLRKNEKKFYTTYHAEMDRKICAEMLRQYDAAVPSSLRPKMLDSLLAAFNHQHDALATYLHHQPLLKASELRKLVNNWEANYPAFQKDVYLRLCREVMNYYSAKVQPQYNALNLKLNSLYAEYVNELKQTMKDRPFYPDANSTLRVAYGKVKGYQPRDGVTYGFYTTLDGIFEKQNTGNEDFIAPKYLNELYAKKDFGQYADQQDGKIHVAFVASNHTTGGNSGSPVFNAKGELIGTNFDRCWEGTMSDILYNPQICRNIVLDVRYTLFVIDKFAGAGYLLNEMKIVR